MTGFPWPLVTVAYVMGMGRAAGKRIVSATNGSLTSLLMPAQHNASNKSLDL